MLKSTGDDSLELILEQLKASACGECEPGMPLIFGEGPARPISCS